MARSEGDLLKVILSVLLPPVGVAMEVGFTAQFWINVVLTLLGYIPGIIHALFIILRR
ncbi:YqaE/Pmp3 family membrane protein [Hyphococcus sp. DH-69]|uniref:YqaE/Pmp3 family membrane protein n=1 Tax=Hyphococcus formosus TaxID=3143534 RepID=UPI00398AD205